MYNVDFTIDYNNNETCIFFSGKDKYFEIYKDLDKCTGIIFIVKSEDKKIIYMDKDLFFYLLCYSIDKIFKENML